jgi:hypothetical protein
MVVGHDELDAMKPAGKQTLQEALQHLDDAASGDALNIHLG